MTVYEIAAKLIGPIDPVGEIGEDANRLRNLEEIATLLDLLLRDLERLSCSAARTEASVSAIGTRAKDVLVDVGESLDKYRDESSREPIQKAMGIGSAGGPLGYKTLRAT